MATVIYVTAGLHDPNLRETIHYIMEAGVSSKETVNKCYM
jgi:hypothetical protein